MFAIDTKKPKAKKIIPTKNKWVNAEGLVVVEYDESGSIGKRYLRAAEAGTPYCITVDHDTLKNNTVTVRDRDTEKQIRVPVEKLHDTLHQLLNKELLFAKAGKLVA